MKKVIILDPEGKYPDDDSGMWRAYKDHHRKRREENWRKADPEGWTVHTPYHWQMLLLGDILDYWPSRNKWRWRGKTHHGNVREFINARTADRPGTGAPDSPGSKGDGL